jgi:hypothetical protein
MVLVGRKFTLEMYYRRWRLCNSCALQPADIIETIQYGGE